MAKLVYDVVVVVGKFINEDKQEKNRYQRIGSVIETKTGLSMKLDAIPIGSEGVAWDGWAYLNEPIRKKTEEPDF
jgi:hypothetical protein